MNPLTPSPRLLRRIASLVAGTDDRAVRSWAEAVRALPRPRRSKRFPSTSVVATYRCQRLCGYEVWRHLDIQRNDPLRKKARVWFGCRRHGGQRRALQLAYFAASTISKMSLTELREWWAEYQAAKAEGRTVSSLWRDEVRHEDGYDFQDKQLCAALRRAG